MTSTFRPRRRESDEEKARGGVDILCGGNVGGLLSASRALARYIGGNVNEELGMSNIFLRELALQMTDILKECAVHSQCRQRGGRRRFKGLFALSELTDRTTSLLATWQFTSAIVNLGTAGGALPTGHFVALLFCPEGCLYADSLGLPPVSPPLLTFIKNTIKQRGGGSLRFNQTRIQHDKSQFCGLFSLLFVSLFEIDMDPLTTVTFYTSNADLMKNDKLCARYLQILINECKHVFTKKEIEK
jgi:hypothetical protein